MESPLCFGFYLFDFHFISQACILLLSSPHSSSPPVPSPIVKRPFDFYPLSFLVISDTGTSRFRRLATSGLFFPYFEESPFVVRPQRLIPFFGLGDP